MSLSAVERLWVTLDYRYLLPLLARLPRTLGRQLATLRGWLYACLERDWRQFSFGDTELAARTRQAHRQMLGAVPAPCLKRSFRRRYAMQSLEELEAAWLIASRLEAIPVRYEGADAVKQALASNGRVVFLIAHAASNLLGTVFLRTFGMPVLGMSSSVVDDPRVPVPVGRFFRQKYAHMSRWLEGGGIVDRQGNTRRFVKFLQTPGMVVVVGDLPPDPGEAVLYHRFLGQRRGFASGAVRLAQLSGAALMSFSCQYVDGGFVVRFSEAGEHPLDFIERQVAPDPGIWWAADLLPLYPLAEKNASIE